MAGVPIGLELRSQDTTGMPWLFVPLPFFFFFIFFFITSWSDFRRDVRGREWKIPSWYDKRVIPFMAKVYQPLNHFHLVAFCLMGVGIVLLMMGSWDLSLGAPVALMFLSSGLGVWAFVRMFCLVFCKGLEDGNSSDPATKSQN